MLLADMFITMTTSRSSHVKDKNNIFTMQDDDINI